MKKFFASKNAIPFPLFGILVFFCFFLLTCSRDQPYDGQIEGILDTHKAAGDSIMAWSQSMSYSEAAQKGVEWLRTQSNVDSCGISEDYTVWIEFEDGTGGDIIPPMEGRKAMDLKEIKDTKPSIIHTPGQGTVKPILPPIVAVLLPFDWEDPLYEYDSLKQILIEEMDPLFGVVPYRDSAVSPLLLKTGFTAYAGLVYLSTHGGISREGGVLLTGEEVTPALREFYAEDLLVGLLRQGYVNYKVYFEFTPSFVSAYWQGSGAQVVFVAACNGWQADMREAFLKKADAYCGFEGLVGGDFFPGLISNLFRPLMQDTFSLSQSYQALPEKSCPYYGATLFIGYGNGVADVILDTYLFSLDGVPLHSGGFLGASAARDNPSGGAISMPWGGRIYDDELNLVGALSIVAGCAEGEYVIGGDDYSCIIYGDTTGLYVYQVSLPFTTPEYGSLSGKITITSLDNPLGLVAGTFSGTLGWWDWENPNMPRSPDKTVQITNGRFKATVYSGGHRGVMNVRLGE